MPRVQRVTAFTLLELLVVFSIMMLLMAVLMPSLSSAREQARRTACGSNLRQIAMANDQYALESGGTYVPGAANHLQNLDRWHGQRKTQHEPFHSNNGPLVTHLGLDGGIRTCPTFEPDSIGFETGCGGYGYNNAYIGVQTVSFPSGESIVTNDQVGTLASRVKRPAQTVMFADSAFVSGNLIEYSFAEPRFHPQYKSRADPSIHFRHARLANVAWCDGHVSNERRTHSWSSGFYEGDPQHFDIGWFGPSDDNSLFDLD